MSTRCLNRPRSDGGTAFYTGHCNVTFADGRGGYSDVSLAACVRAARDAIAAGRDPIVTEKTFDYEHCAWIVRTVKVAL